jgi:4-amino-4-deoxy-L-arabinose transferase-like glycosyltransferase
VLGFLRHPLILILIGSLGMAIDRVWLHWDQSVPDWDQADYLTGAMNYWRAFEHPQWLSRDWWVGLWLLSSKIPPFVYMVTAGVMKLGGTGPDQALIVQLGFSAILILSVYGMGRRLFSPLVGLWAAGLTMVLPGLYPLRHIFLLDHPLVAMVTLSFALLTYWHQPARIALALEADRPEPPAPSSKTELQLLQETIAQLPERRELGKSPLGSGFSQRIAVGLIAIGQPLIDLIEGFDRNPWLKITAFGIALGLTFLTKQTVVFFLFLPITWIGLQTIFLRQWRRFWQLLVGLVLAVAIAYPWYRTNWLLILTAGERATVASAAMEGDPGLNTWAAWTYYLKEIIPQVSLPLFVVGIVGLLLYSKRLLKRGNRQDNWRDSRLRVSREERRSMDQNFQRSRRWLMVFILGSYVLCSLNVNKDTRYIAPLLPVLSILLAQGLLLLPKYLSALRLGLLGLMALLMISDLFPLLPGRTMHLAKPPQNWHQRDAIATIIQAEPYLRHNVGVLPSLPELNQHNVNYFGTLANFQVYGRQVGDRLKRLWTDGRSMSWYLVKTGNQGAIRQPEALNALTKSITSNQELKLEQSWKLPDNSDLQLYRRSNPSVSVTPVIGTQWGDEQLLRLEQVIVPSSAGAGKAVPVTYKWAGNGADLQAGLLLLGWTDQTGAKPAWLHDHGVGLGQLTNLDGKTLYQVTETLAMLPPKDALGTYGLEITYLNRTTGETYPLVPPNVTVTIVPDSPPETPGSRAVAPELDPGTQLQIMARDMPKGVAALDKIFDRVASLNLYDPTQDYLLQAQISLTHRLKDDPKNQQLAYAYALTQILQRNVEGAIAAFQTVTELDAQNPNAQAFLAFVNLVDFRASAARRALTQAEQMPNRGKEILGLRAIARFMQLDWLGAWQDFQVFQKEK